MPQLQSARYAGRNASKAAMNALTHRLKSLETIGRTCGMNADDFRVGVFDRDEDIGLAFARGNRLRHVRSPHFIDVVGDDHPVVRLGRGPPHAMRREQFVLTHDTPHAAGARANVGDAQSRPYLAIALAVKTGARDGMADMFPPIRAPTH